MGPRFPALRRQLVLAERARRTPESGDPELAEEARLVELEGILAAGCATDPRVDFSRLKVRPPVVPSPALEGALPDRPLFPDAAVASAPFEAVRLNAEVDAFRSGYVRHERGAVIEYFALVLDDDVLPAGIPESYGLGYDPATRRLEVERALPGIEVIPKGKRRPPELKRRHARVVAQIVLRTLRAIAAADSADAVVTIAFTGSVAGEAPVRLVVEKGAILALPLPHVNASAALQRFQRRRGSRA